MTASTGGKSLPTALTTATGRVSPYEFASELVVSEPWMQDALCAQVGAEMFFPEKGGSTRDAKKICTTCEVKAQCLDYALRNDERFGIWGGLSERERRKVARTGVRPDFPEGSPATPVPVVGESWADQPVSSRTTWTHRQNARMKQLVAEGASDRQIAKALHVEPYVIWNWRAKAGLKPNREAPVRKAKPPRRRYHRWTDEDLQAVRELNALGVTDSEIARRIGHTQADVSKKRRGMDLPPVGHFPGRSS